MNYRKFFLAWYTVIALFVFGVSYVDEYEVPSHEFGQTNGARALVTAAVWPLWLSVKISQKWIVTPRKATCTSMYMT